MNQVEAPKLEDLNIEDDVLVGEYYWVNSVKIQPDAYWPIQKNCKKIWFPVVGNAHEDSVVISGVAQKSYYDSCEIKSIGSHYHIDRRFMSPIHFAVLCCATITPMKIRKVDKILNYIKNCESHNQMPEKINPYEHNNHNEDSFKDFLKDMAIISLNAENNLIIDGPEYRLFQCQRQDTPPPNELTQEIVNQTNKEKYPNIETQFAKVKLKSNKCPHQGIPLGGAAKENGCVICPAHGLAWDIETGEMVNRQEENKIDDCAAR